MCQNGDFTRINSSLFSFPISDFFLPFCTTDKQNRKTSKKTVFSISKSKLQFLTVCPLTGRSFFGTYPLSSCEQLQKQNQIFQRGFQMHQIAFSAQANTHDAFPFSGLHGEHVYFIFLRCSSATATTVLSSRSINISINSRADCGHCTMHLAQPMHFSASITT
jgi:hypothetical protein